MSRRNDKWIVFRIVFGCASRPIVGIDAPSNINRNVTQTISTQDDTKKNDSCTVKKTKQPLGLIKFRRANISLGIQRLIRNLKNASKIFVYKNEMDYEDEDEDESELEIGYPTDVKHLTHIGWDGSTTVSKQSEQSEGLTPSEIISFPSISLKQFEAAMAQQAAGASANINNV